MPARPSYAWSPPHWSFADQIPKLHDLCEPVLASSALLIALTPNLHAAVRREAALGPDPFAVIRMEGESAAEMLALSEHLLGRIQHTLEVFVVRRFGPNLRVEEMIGPERARWLEVLGRVEPRPRISQQEADDEIRALHRSLSSLGEEAYSLLFDVMALTRPAERSIPRTGVPPLRLPVETIAAEPGFIHALANVDGALEGGFTMNARLAPAGMDAAQLRADLTLARADAFEALELLNAQVLHQERRRLRNRISLDLLQLCVGIKRVMDVEFPTEQSDSIEIARVLLETLGTSSHPLADTAVMRLVNGIRAAEALGDVEPVDIPDARTRVANARRRMEKLWVLVEH